MESGRIVLLNGTSSAGKTTLARALQRLWPQPIQYFALDQFRDGMCGRYRGLNAQGDEPGTRGLNVVPAQGPRGPFTALQFGDVGRRTLAGMRRAAAAFANSGIDVVMDDLLLEPAFLRDYLVAFENIAVTFVGVRCRRAVVEARESARPGRFPGTAAGHFDSVHAHCRYDIEIDTTASTPAECAQRILAVVGAPPSPTAFDRLRQEMAR